MLKYRENLTKISQVIHNDCEMCIFAIKTPVDFLIFVLISPWGGATLYLMVVKNNTVDVVPKRIFRQHRSLVVVLPKFLLLDLGLSAGDYLMFSKARGCKTAKVHKLEGQSDGG